MAVTGSGSAVANIRRVVVGIKARDASGITLANFVDCIVNYFNPNSLSAKLCCTLENNVLVLSHPPDPDKQFVDEKNVTNGPDSNNVSPTHNRITECTTVTLVHSPECPFWRMRDGRGVIPPEKREQGVQVGVAMILESSDEHILITQRASHMRTFPRSWVPPGGHLELGETLVEGGLRELEEETGLDLRVVPHQTRLLCLWESVYPPFLGMGNPTNHHVVVYLHARVDAPWSELQTRLKLEADEVQGCAWLSQQDVEAAFCPDNPPLYVDKWVTDGGTDGRLVSEPLDLTGLFRMRVADRNYSGLQLALSKWLEVKTEVARPPSKI